MKAIFSLYSMVWLVCILVLAICGIALALDIVTTYQNEWVWLPASGTPVTYLVEKFTSGAWKEYDTVPADVQADGFVHTTIASRSFELYKIRVTAIDAAGNHGPVSPESDWLLVYEELPVPGKPTIK